MGYYAIKIIENPNDEVDGFFFKTTDKTKYLIGYIGNDEELILPENYKGENYRIEEMAFEGYTNLTKVTIPNSVTSIDDNAFNGCTNLKTVINFSKLTIEKGSEDNGYVGYYATKVINADGQVGNFFFTTIGGVHTLTDYLENDGGKRIVLPDSYNGENYKIGNAVFSNWSNLTNLTIPNSVTSIEKDAFRSCTNLTDITIGNAIEVIGDYAFGGCENLKSITVAATTPPSVENQDFTTTDFRTIVVRVPRGSLSAYQNANFWKSFWNIEEFDATGIEDVQMDIHNATAPIYTQQGVQVKEVKENLPAGIYIQNGKKFIVK